MGSLPCANPAVPPSASRHFLPTRCRTDSAPSNSLDARGGIRSARLHQDAPNDATAPGPGSSSRSSAGGDDQASSGLKLGGLDGDGPDIAVAPDDHTHRPTHGLADQQPLEVGDVLDRV